MLHTRHLTLLALLLGAMLLAAPLRAQESGVVLELRRDWGYGGLSGDIEGTFTLRAKGPADLSAVTFLIDDQEMVTDREAPFQLQFRTGDYDLGRHELTATGVTASGETLLSNIVIRNFVTASAGWQSGLRMAIPVLVIALVAVLVGVLVESRNAKRHRGAKGRWGTAICPKCGEPFALHLFAPNLGMRKFDRCPYCGKWSVVGRARPDELAALEAAARPDSSGAAPTMTPEDRRRQRLEDSRFEDT